MRFRLKCQRVNIIPPNGWFAGWHQSIFGVVLRQLGGSLSGRGRQSIDSLHDPMPRLRSVVAARVNQGNAVGVRECINPRLPPQLRIVGDPGYTDQIILDAPRRYEVAASFKW